MPPYPDARDALPLALQFHLLGLFELEDPATLDQRLQQRGHQALRPNDRPLTMRSEARACYGLLFPPSRTSLLIVLARQ